VPLSPNHAYTNIFKIQIEYLFCGDESELPDSTTSNPDDVRTEPKDVEPGASGSGGIVTYDHDNDPTTPPLILVPGTNTMYSEPNSNGISQHQTFLPEGIDPSTVTSIETGQLNPCAAAPCSAQELADGKDLVDDLIITTTKDEPSFTMLSDPNSPTYFKSPIAIGSTEDDDRATTVADVNGKKSKLTHFLCTFYAYFSLARVCHQAMERQTSYSSRTTRPTKCTTAIRNGRVITAIPSTTSLAPRAMVPSPSRLSRSATTCHPTL
jgi:hypothetical protein